MAHNGWEAVIGLEIHAQLKTKTKIFSADSAEFGGGDNEHTGIFSLGLPGSLPVLNQSVIEQAVKAGLALNCKINEFSRFSRKSYFYPDMPKGYQITQYEEPICGEGSVTIVDGDGLKSIGVERAHLEEDAGKSTHHGQYTLINLNRSGVPLLEIVSRPEMKTPSQAAEYARTVRRLLRYAGVCDGNLEEGSLRVDCNVSVKKESESQLGTKVEIKNLNSFRFIEKAVEFEIQRQIEALETGVEIVQETRLFDSVKGQTFTMRKKEQAEDYRYFPDPDLLPCLVTEDVLKTAQSEVGERPLEKATRYIEEHSVSRDDAFLITEELETANYFEAAVASGGEAKALSHWLTGEVLRTLNDDGLSIDAFSEKVPALHLAELTEKVKSGEISGKMAKKVFAESYSSGEAPSKVIDRLGLKQITDTGAIESLIDGVIARHQAQVDEYKSGKTKVFGFFVGQIMKESKGQASPDLVNQILKKKLES